MSLTVSPARACWRLILSKLLLALGIAGASAGATLWIAVPDILARQEEHFDEFIRAQMGVSTNSLQEVQSLRRKVLLSAGLYPGWPQAVIPVAIGAALVATSHYLRQQADHANTHSIGAPERS